MGRNRDSVVRSFFNFDTTQNKSICIVCDAKLTGKHVTNLRRHLVVKHTDIFENTQRTRQVHCEVEKKKIKISYEINKEDFISSIVKIVTKDGIPFIHLDSEGFRDIVDPIYNALSMSPISSHNIMDYVFARQQSIAAEIKQLVKGRLVALKIDIATRMERSVLCVNLQIIDSRNDKAEIIVKTLGIIHPESQTRKYIKEKLLEIIREYSIGVDQIYSITSDNWINMINTIKILNDDLHGAEESLDNNEVMEILDTISISNICLVRCPAYTLQLSVNDVQKHEDVAKHIDVARKLCKLLRTDKYRRTLIQSDQIVPPIDVVTRWNTTFLMVKELYGIRDFVRMEFKAIAANVDWDWLELYINAFQPVYAATLKFQQEQLILTEFFILWMELKLQCEESSNYLTKKLLTSLKGREDNLLENEAMLAAIYMDPRINIILTDQQKIIAIQNLKKTAIRIFKMKQELAAETSSPANTYITTENSFESVESNTLVENSQELAAETNSPANPYTYIKTENSFECVESNTLVENSQELAAETNSPANTHIKTEISFECVESNNTLVENSQELVAETNSPTNTDIKTENSFECMESNNTLVENSQELAAETNSPANTDMETENSFECVEGNNTLFGNSLLSVYLDKIQDVAQTSTEETIPEQLNKIYIDIENFAFTYRRLPLNSNLFEFFEKIKYKSLHLFELALVVLATPATQVSVERAFSALNFILSERQYQLNTETINALLVVKLNS